MNHLLKIIVALIVLAGIFLFARNYFYQEQLEQRTFLSTKQEDKNSLLQERFENTRHGYSISYPFDVPIGTSNDFVLNQYETQDDIYFNFPWHTTLVSIRVYPLNRNSSNNEYSGVVSLNLKDFATAIWEEQELFRRVKSPKETIFLGKEAYEFDLKDSFSFLGHWKILSSAKIGDRVYVPVYRFLVTENSNREKIVIFYLISLKESLKESDPEPAELILIAEEMIKSFQFE